MKMAEMEDKSKVIFGNVMPDKVYKKAVKSKEKYLKKYPDDPDVSYNARIRKNPVIGDSLGVMDIRLEEGESAAPFDEEKGIIVGNIRMGFGHYRISMAMASCAKALGYTPYWLDLNSFPKTTCTKVISAQNDLYSLGSRMSKNPIFNKLVWEPVNYEGFRALSYNASDQKNAELMAPVYQNIPKDIPVIGTHVWLSPGGGPCRYEVCRQCDSGQLAHGPSFRRGGGSHDPVPQRLSGLPDIERHDEEAGMQAYAQ